jgi:hypothetical protein
MRLAYRPYAIDPSPADPSTVSFRPELLVRLIGPRGRSDEITVWGLLDTGALDCILPWSLADQLNPTWYGPGWAADYASGSHEVMYGGVHLQVRVENQRVRWPAIVAFSRDRMNIPLWGRCGFLQHFNVTFNGPGHYFIIRLRKRLPAGYTVDSVPRASRRGPRGSDLIVPGDQNP